MGGFYPYNPLLNQVMQTGVEGVTCDRGFMAHLHWLATEAVVAATAGVLVAIPVSGVATVQTDDFIALPCAKNITATVSGGTAGNIKAVQCIIEGHDIAGNVITETLPAFTVDTAGTVVGSKAFADVTKLTVPAMDGADVTVALGYGEKLGLPFTLSHNTVLVAFENNTKEGTAPTVTVDAANLSGNTIDLNTALQGRVVDVYLVA